MDSPHETTLDNNTLHGHIHSNDDNLVYDPALLFTTEQSHISNLAFLPILAMLIFLVCIILKVYNWSREDARHKARGDVEFGDDSELNYGIINEGDKEYCNIDMRGDGISVYDTVNSFRSLSNGFAPSINSPQYYHDTVTSIKSLVLQKADGSQYDSVKSYKAFLEKITQDKDLAVEVKLLENYPSVEHCVVFEEESSEKSGEVSTKILKSLPLKKHIHSDARLHQFERKKPSYKQGDNHIGMRKRSASNPSYRRCAGGTSSMPSVRYLVSSDSDEDVQEVDRRKLWAERKKMSRSVSGGKISKATRDLNLENGNETHQRVACRRKRHYSADSARRHKKLASAFHKGDKHQPRDRSQVKKVNDEESSSENPNSSSDSNLPSESVASDTSEDETKQITLISNASDDRTMENDVFFSLDSGTELASSYEVLQNSPHQRISETKKSIARAKEEFFKKISESSTLKVPNYFFSIDRSQNDKLNGDVLNQANTFNLHNHKAQTFEAQQQQGFSSQSSTTCAIINHSIINCKEKTQTKSTLQGSSDLPNGPSDCDSQGEMFEGVSDLSAEGHGLSSPRKVQRFHVSFVHPNLSNPQSD